MNPRRDDQQPDRVAGPVIERRGQVHEGSTTDQRLLDSRGATDWVHTDPWRVLRIQSEFVEGFDALASLGPAVTLFGSARTPEEDPMYAAAVETARLLGETGHSIITGGGPGIMEAANRGARIAGAYAAMEQIDGMVDRAVLSSLTAFMDPNARMLERRPGEEPRMESSGSEGASNLAG